MEKVYNRHDIFIAPTSGMAQYRDPVFSLFIHPSVYPSLNICDHPSVDPTVQVRNSETLSDTLAKLDTKYKASDSVY